MIGALIGFGALLALASAAPAPEQAEIDGLIAQLASDDRNVREDGACGLGRLGGVASRAVPALAGVLQQQVIDSAGVATSRRQRSQDMSVDHCKLARAERRGRVQYHGSFGVWTPDEWSLAWSHGPVTWAIVRLDGSEVVARSLLDMFRREPELRCDNRRVPELLGTLGPKALPALEEGLRDEVAQVRYFAVQALPDLRPLPPGVEKLLQHTIDWDTGDVRTAAVQGLESVRAQRKQELEVDAREERRAAASRKDWLAEFPAYPGASKVCSGHVLGSADGKRREIAFSLYATKDEPTTVVGFYASARSIKAERGATTVTVRSVDEKKVLSVHPVSGSYPDCGVKPPRDAKAVVVVSQMTP